MFRLIFNPWRRAREVQAQLDRVTQERDNIEHALAQSCDRYDKVREMNNQLRDALALYRSR
jgi:septal ring factor EnvC (AmiA/AmiB activator)